MLHVGLVTWNHYSDTAECLATLFAADYPADRLAVWIVDNASADETVAGIRRDFPRVHLIENTWNAGFAPAMNQAMRAALITDSVDGKITPPDYFLILNNDTLVDPAMLQTLVDALEADSSAAVAAPSIYYEHKRELIWYGGGGVDPVACRAWHKLLRTPGPIPETTEPTGYATGCGMLVRADALREHGVFDEGYFMYWEDADLCRRFQSAELQVLYVPGATLYHKVSTSTGGNLSPKKMWRKFNAGYRFWSRHHRGAGWQWRYLQSSWQSFREAKAAR